MEIRKLLDRLFAQNEMIIQQNVELLLAVGALLEDRSRGATKVDEAREFARTPSSKQDS